MPRKILIHKSLYKPVLFVGCERLPFTIVATIGGVMLMSYLNLYAIILVLLFYVISIVLIRRVNETDSQFFKCLYRYVRYYNDYYPANAFYPGRKDIPKNGFE